jgi:GTPase SAR1 family protein
MGSALSRAFRRKRHKIRVLLLGLDNAGKTTTLYRLKVESSIMTVPTVGFNIESFILDKKHKFTIWVPKGK